MAKPDSLIIERRDFLRRVMPACALGCLGVCGSAGAAVAAAARPLPCQEQEVQKHKFDEEFPVPLTLRQYFARQLGQGVQPLKAIGEEIGEEELIRILEGYSFARGARLGKEDSERRGVTDFHNYNERFRSGQMDRIITFTIVEDTENVFEINVTECALVEPLRDADAGLIGNAWLCHGDYGHAQGYSPKIKMVRDKTLMKGDAICNHRYEWTG